MTVRVLGVDPGSRLCGYAVIDVMDSRSFGYVECGVLTPPAKESTEARLGDIARWLTDVVNELRPVVLAVEDVFSGINPRTALALAQARGTVLAVAGLSSLAVHSYPPATVKQSVTGRGNAPKEQVAKMVAALVGLHREPQPDAADALAVALTHGMHCRNQLLYEMGRSGT